jgi:hypothetical protein
MKPGAMKPGDETPPRKPGTGENTCPPVLTAEAQERSRDRSADTAEEQGKFGKSGKGSGAADARQPASPFSANSNKPTRIAAAEGA